MRTEVITKENMLNLKEDSACNLVLGFFDGIHLGHQFLIKEALKDNDNVIVLSLMNSFKKDDEVVISFKQKEEILSSLNVKKLYLLNDDLFFKNMSYLDFISLILKRINPLKIYVGNDYKFGKNREGNVDILKQYFDVSIVDFYLVNNEKVSTSLIKNYLKEGNVEAANYLLGRNYCYEGKVVKGLNNGSKFLFPTINLELDSNFTLLKRGVYQTKVIFKGKVYDSITNIGVHPTIDKLTKPSIETFILNFSENIYEENIKLQFIKFIREEKMFSSLDQLKQQILKDIKNCGLKI